MFISDHIIGLPPFTLLPYQINNILYHSKGLRQSILSKLYRKLKQLYITQLFTGCGDTKILSVPSVVYNKFIMPRNTLYNCHCIIFI